MPAALQHADSATLMGSWPFLGATSTSIAPNALEPRATILGVRRETGAGFDVGAKALLLWIDGDVSGRAISFPVGGPYTLEEVVDFINTDAGLSVAYRDNGFLRLESPTDGNDSYLRLEVDAVNLDNFDLFEDLGLFSETEAFGGAIASAKHIDPDRQVAIPGQKSLLNGEDFTQTAFNRAVFQLSVNDDVSENLLSKKRIAIRKEFEISAYTPGAAPGVVLPDDVYTGPSASPDATELEPYFAVLDANGREFTHEIEGLIATADIDYSVDAESGKQVVSEAGWFSYSIADTDSFIKPSGLTGGPSVLNGKLLPVVGIIDTNNAIIDPTDPDTGLTYDISESSVTSELIWTYNRRCFVDAVFEDDSEAQRVEQWQETKVGSTPVDRIVSSDTLYISTVNFVSVGVQEGDIVEWSGYGTPTPYSNDGTYRVARIVDIHTLKLVAEDWGPVFFNTATALGIGDIVIKTDGTFRKNPFLRFLAEPNGVIPETGTTLRIVYMGMGSIREATDDPASFAGYGVRYTQEADDTLQRAIVRLYGPSAESIDDVLALSPLHSLEAVRKQVEDEHHPTDTPYGGRHSDIRPDRIDMWADIDNEQITLRSTATDEGAGAIDKLRLQSSADDTVWSVDESGNVNFLENLGQRLFFDGGDGQPQNLTTAGSFFIGLFIFPLGTYWYRVTSVDSMGNESTPSASASVTVDWSSVDIVHVQWDPVPGAQKYRVYRSTDAGFTDEAFTGEWRGEYFFDPAGHSTSAGTPPVTGTRTALQLSSDGSQSTLSGPLSVNGGEDSVPLSVASNGLDQLLSLMRNNDGEISTRLSVEVTGASQCHLNFDSWDPLNQTWNRKQADRFLSSNDRAFYDAAGTPQVWFDILDGRVGIDGGSGFAANPDAPLHVHVQGDDLIVRWEKHGGTGDRTVDYNFTSTRDMLEMDFAAGEVIGYDLSTGNVWIGTTGTDPVQRLHVGGNIRADGTVIVRGTLPGFTLDDDGTARTVLKAFGDSSSGLNTLIDSSNTTLIVGGEHAAGTITTLFSLDDGAIRENLYLGADQEVHIVVAGQSAPAVSAAYWNASGHFMPGADDARNMGSDALRWNDIFAQDGNFDGTVYFGETGFFAHATDSNWPTLQFETSATFRYSRSANTYQWNTPGTGITMELDDTNGLYVVGNCRGTGDLGTSAQLWGVVWTDEVKSSTNPLSRITLGTILNQGNGYICPDGGTHNFSGDRSTGNMASFKNDNTGTGGRIQDWIGGPNSSTATYTFISAKRNTSFAETGIIRTNAGVFQIVDVSDPRMKDDIAPSQVDGLDIINRLDLIEYRFKPDKGEDKVAALSRPKNTCGFNARQCREVYPEMVSELTQKDYDGSPLYGTARSALVPVLVKAIQELTERLEKLEGRS